MSESITVESLSERLQNSVSYAVPVQLLTSALGIILSYHNPEMPVEVVFAYSTIVGISLNVVYAVLRFLGAKLVKEKN